MARSNDAFVGWAKGRAIPVDVNAAIDDFRDLAPLKALIGDAQVVGHGESHHYTREYNRFRSRLFRFLVAEMGFTTFVLEVGFVEAKVAHDYVALRHDDDERAFLSVNQSFGLWAQQQEMLDWMRAYNSGKPAAERLRFYGMDGSIGWEHSGVALEAVCRYLDRTDPGFAAEVRHDILPLAQKAAHRHLKRISEEMFHRLLAGLTNVVGRFEVEQMHYIERSEQDDFHWALSFAIMAQQIATMLAQVRALPGQGLRAWSNVRDYNMAQQLRWILEREGPEARVLFGAHNLHLQACYDRETEDLISTMGQYLQGTSLASEMVLIAGTSNYSLKPNDPAAPGSNQAALAELGLSSFLLDLRPAAGSKAVHDWLSERRLERANTNYQPLALADAYDVIHYTESLSLDELRLPSALRWDAVALAEPELDGLVGKYLFSGMADETEELYIIREGARLFTDVGNQNGELFLLYKSELFAISRKAFRWREWPMELTFELDEDGIAQSAIVRFPLMDWVFVGKKSR